MFTIVAFMRIGCVRDNKMDIIVVQNNRNKCGIVLLYHLQVIAIDQPFHFDDSFDILLKLS